MTRPKKPLDPNSYRICRGGYLISTVAAGVLARVLDWNDPSRLSLRLGFRAYLPGRAPRGD